MRASEGRYDLRQCDQVKVKQAANGMMVVEPVGFGGKRAEASGALESLDAWYEIPAVAPVAAYRGSTGAHPRIMQQHSRNGRRRFDV